MQLDLPTRLGGAAREQVALRQIADMSGQSPGQLDMRPFHGPGRPGGWSRVLVADAARMDTWRAQAGRARAILPDYLALPAAPGLWTIRCDGTGDTGQVTARLGLEDGFSADAALAALLLRRALDKAGDDDRPKAILWQGDPLPALQSWAEAANIPTTTKPRELKPHGVAAPKVLGHGELGFDLRRDPRATRARLKARVLPWRWPVMAGLVAAALWAGAQIMAIDRLTAARDHLAASTIEVVRARFVPSGPILDVRTQVSRALTPGSTEDAGAAETSPIDLFGSAAEVMLAQGARVGRVTFTPSEGLRVTAVVDDFSALDRLVAGLEAAGQSATVIRSRAVDDGAEAVLSLQGATP